MKPGVHFNILLTLLFLLNQVFSLNILGVFPYQGKSHFFVFETFLKELASKGHRVTVISHFPQKEPIDNYQDISLAGKSKILEDVFPLKSSYMTVIAISLFLVNYGTDNCRTLLADERVQNLWKTKAKFDVVVTEQFNSDCSLGLAYKLGAPVVGMTTHVFMPWHYERFGIVFNPSYVAMEFFGGGTKPTFYQRVERILFHAYFNTLYKYFSHRIDEQTLAQYFDDVPPLEELAREIKFFLLYSHPVLFGPNLFASNIIDVNGYHVAKPKELPDDLKKFIEEAEHGVIYISFGSMLKAATTPIDKVEAIVGALSELPQRVIWKWEEKSLPGNPKNFYISSWLPQNDILAHPKVLAFYSHCGLLGTTEALHHGVPVVGMPVFGDQPGNAAAVEESGLGVQIQVSDLTKERLLEKFKTVLDPKFRSQVKFLSKAWHDRPTSAMDTAIYWTEYAARYRNITFRVRAADVPFYQYLYLDVISTFSVFIIVIFLVSKVLFSQLLNKIKEQSNSVTEKKTN
ncbi:hypothetical protein K1T71_008262 [Dendrolimus kikuchii]|uniref:Uncharacterized protein n=1 Tax=Dendrolimus kikuchii TaxID=765133 RepID=A0ACC1CWQ9_9NEOP|nr:hypothetical protein K1T71_008262 [Dendrolimus kikuchii]